jgi:hypothetical protein
MVYVVQNYLASFGLCPSSGMWKFYERPQCFGDWICLLTGLRLGLSGGPNWVGLPCPIHTRKETDPVSETLWSFVKLPHTRRCTKSKRSQIVLYNHKHVADTKILNYIWQTTAKTTKLQLTKKIKDMQDFNLCSTTLLANKLTYEVTPYCHWIANFRIHLVHVLYSWKPEYRETIVKYRFSVW